MNGASATVAANEMKSSSGLLDRALAVIAAIVAAALLCAASSRAEDGEATCDVPETVVLRGSAGSFTFTRDGGPNSTHVLEELGLWTKAIWTLRAFAPAVARDEVGIHLYASDNAQFLADYTDVDQIRIVRFFVACEGKRGYTVAPASVSRNSDDAGIGAAAPEAATAYLGLTIAPQGTKPKATLKGQLSAFDAAQAID